MGLKGWVRGPLVGLVLVGAVVAAHAANIVPPSKQSNSGVLADYQLFKSKVTNQSPDQIRLGDLYAWNGQSFSEGSATADGEPLWGYHCSNGAGASIVVPDEIRKATSGISVVLLFEPNFVHGHRRLWGDISVRDGKVVWDGVGVARDTPANRKGLVSAKKWVQMSATFTAATKTVEIYVNNVRVLVVAGIPNFSLPREIAFLHNRDNQGQTGYTGGLIARVRVFDHALTEAQMSLLHNLPDDLDIVDTTSAGSNHKHGKAMHRAHKHEKRHHSHESREVDLDEVQAKAAPADVDVEEEAKRVAAEKKREANENKRNDDELGRIQEELDRIDKNHKRKQTLTELGYETQVLSHQNAVSANDDTNLEDDENTMRANEAKRQKAEAYREANALEWEKVSKDDTAVNPKSLTQRAEANLRVKFDMIGDDIKLVDKKETKTEQVLAAIRSSKDRPPNGKSAGQKNSADYNAAAKFTEAEARATDMKTQIRHINDELGSFRDTLSAIHKQMRNMEDDQIPADELEVVDGLSKFLTRLQRMTQDLWTKMGTENIPGHINSLMSGLDALTKEVKDFIGRLPKRTLKRNALEKMFEQVASKSTENVDTQRDMWDDVQAYKAGPMAELVREMEQRFESFSQGLVQLGSDLDSKPDRPIDSSELQNVFSTLDGSKKQVVMEQDSLKTQAHHLAGIINRTKKLLRKHKAWETRHIEALKEVNPNVELPKVPHAPAERYLEILQEHLVKLPNAEDLSDEIKDKHDVKNATAMIPTPLEEATNTTSLMEVVPMEVDMNANSWWENPKNTELLSLEERVGKGGRRHGHKRKLEHSGDSKHHHHAEKNHRHHVEKKAHHKDHHKKEDHHKKGHHADAQPTKQDKKATSILTPHEKFYKESVDQQLADMNKDLGSMDKYDKDHSGDRDSDDSDDDDSEGEGSGDGSAEGSNDDNDVASDGTATTSSPQKTMGDQKHHLSKASKAPKHSHKGKGRSHKRSHKRHNSNPIIVDPNKEEDEKADQAFDKMMGEAESLSSELDDIDNEDGSPLSTAAPAVKDGNVEIGTTTPSPTSESAGYDAVDAFMKLPSVDGSASAGAKKDGKVHKEESTGSTKPPTKSRQQDDLKPHKEKAVQVEASHHGHHHKSSTQNAPKKVSKQAPHAKEEGQLDTVDLEESERSDKKKRNGDDYEKIQSAMKTIQSMERGAGMLEAKSRLVDESHEDMQRVRDSLGVTPFSADEDVHEEMGGVQFQHDLDVVPQDVNDLQTDSDNLLRKERAVLSGKTEKGHKHGHRVHALELNEKPTNADLLSPEMKALMQQQASLKKEFDEMDKKDGGFMSMDDTDDGEVAPSLDYEGDHPTVIKNVFATKKRADSDGHRHGHHRHHHEEMTKTNVVSAKDQPSLEEATSSAQGHIKPVKAATNITATAPESSRDQSAKSPPAPVSSVESPQNATADNPDMDTMSGGASLAALTDSDSHGEGDGEGEGEGIHGQLDKHTNETAPAVPSASVDSPPVKSSAGSASSSSDDSASGEHGDGEEGVVHMDVHVEPKHYHHHHVRGDEHAEETVPATFDASSDDAHGSDNSTSGADSTPPAQLTHSHNSSDPWSYLDGDKDSSLNSTSGSAHHGHAASNATVASHDSAKSAVGDAVTSAISALFGAHGKSKKNLRAHKASTAPNPDKSPSLDEDTENDGQPTLPMYIRKYPALANVTEETRGCVYGCFVQPEGEEGSDQLVKKCMIKCMVGMKDQIESQVNRTITEEVEKETDAVVRNVRVLGERIKSNDNDETISDVEEAIGKIVKHIGEIQEQSSDHLEQGKKLIDKMVHMASVAKQKHGARMNVIEKIVDKDAAKQLGDEDKFRKLLKDLAFEQYQHVERALGDFYMKFRDDDRQMDIPEAAKPSAHEHVSTHAESEGLSGLASGEFHDDKSDVFAWKLDHHRNFNDYIHEPSITPLDEEAESSPAEAPHAAADAVVSEAHAAAPSVPKNVVTTAVAAAKHINGEPGPSPAMMDLAEKSLHISNKGGHSAASDLVEKTVKPSRPAKPAKPANSSPRNVLHIQPHEGGVVGVAKGTNAKGAAKPNDSVMNEGGGEVFPLPFEAKNDLDPTSRTHWTEFLNELTNKLDHAFALHSAKLDQTDAAVTDATAATVDVLKLLKALRKTVGNLDLPEKWNKEDSDRVHAGEEEGREIDGRQEYLEHVLGGEAEQWKKELREQQKMDKEKVLRSLHAKARRMLDASEAAHDLRVKTFSHEYMKTMSMLMSQVSTLEKKLGMSFDDVKSKIGDMEANMTEKLSDLAAEKPVLEVE